MTRYGQPISDASVDQLLAIQGVNSVGVGMDGGERVIVVGIESRGVDVSQVPPEIEGLRVVTEVEGGASPASAAPPLADDSESRLPQPMSVTMAQRHRPLRPGISIGHEDITAGTASFFAADGRTIYQLSNNHVLAKYDEAEPGDPILQPGPHDGGTAEDEVGVLEDYVPVEAEGNTVDLAWFEPAVDFDDRLIDLDEMPTPQVMEPEVGDTVTFIGRTSGVTTATVDRVNVAVNVQTAPDEQTQFVNQFRIDKRFIPGDSGAPVLIETEDGYVPVGIGFAATDSVGFANPITAVEEASGMTVLPVATGSIDPITSGLPENAGWVLGLGLLAAILYRDTK